MRTTATKENEIQHPPQCPDTFHQVAVGTGGGQRGRESRRVEGFGDFAGWCRGLHLPRRRELSARRSCAAPRGPRPHLRIGASCCGARFHPPPGGWLFQLKQYQRVSWPADIGRISNISSQLILISAGAGKRTPGPRTLQNMSLDPLKTVLSAGDTAENGAAR